jgi:membrane associated rhomboid family serine protease
MPTCDACGRRADLSHHCTECDGTYCGRHRLPEAHDCTALGSWGGANGGAGGRTAAGSGGAAATPGGREEATAGSTDRGGTGLDRSLGPLEGRVTYLFLSVMALTFLAQSILFPLAGYGPRSAVWQAAFLLSAEHVGYVWTWVTHVFAHAGPLHLLLNGVVIFFFGRLVEEYLGSARYAVVFLASGVVAGLSQISVYVAQGAPGAGLGASGAALAVMGLLTGINPRLRVYVYFVIPVPIWLFTGAYAATTLRNIQRGGVAAGGVAELAHLVGLLVGVGYGLYLKGRGRRLPEHLRFGGGERS